MIVQHLRVLSCRRRDKAITDVDNSMEVLHLLVVSQARQGLIENCYSGDFAVNHGDAVLRCSFEVEPCRLGRK